ncbi:hypothetical protein ACLESD_33435, partial [Pyxidicoccus sp. 3LFB2]
VQAFPPGTPAYRSPEAWRYMPRSGRPPEVPYAPGPGDDVFALGVTAYRLLTGKYPPPTHPDDEDAWMWRPEERESWSPRAQNARCCLELSALVFRMLSPHPEARGSAREVAEALELAACKAGAEADAPLFTGEEPQPAGLMPVPQHVTAPRRREASRQEPQPAGLMPVPLHMSPTSRHEARRQEPRPADLLPVPQHGSPSSSREARRQEPQPAGLMPAPRHVTAPPRREAEQEFRPGELMPASQHITVPTRREASSPWFTAASLGAALALGAVGVLSVQAIELPEPRPQAAQEEARDGGTSAVGDSALTAPVEPDRAPFVGSTFAEDLPPKPFPGQRRPNASGRCPGKVQVPINGGCWRKLPVDVKDCDDEESFVYKGVCYAPVLAQPRPSTSGPSKRSHGPSR